MKLGAYLSETRNEMKHMNWPTKSQAMRYTLLVIGLSVVFAIVLALADKIFALGLQQFIFGN
ncbi:MAG TPA: preprotein translocase subunit SecE [Candidatus Paceibacterota bacterium]